MKIHVYPLDKLSGSVAPPSSKNYTTRYILVSCLAEGESVINFPAKSDDSEAAVECCAALGAKISKIDENTLIINGFGNRPLNPKTINPHNAGAVLRFMLGIASLLPEVKFISEHSQSLGKRPNKDLLDALAQIGVKSESDDGRLPITLYGGNLKGGDVSISGETSSQYLSSLLFLSPLIGQDIRINVINGLKSKPLIKTTLEVMKEAGIDVFASEDLLYYDIKGGQKYNPRTWEVNGDWPGAIALLSAAAVLNSDVKITRLYEDQQGEREGLNILRKMGVDIKHENNIVHIKGNGILKGGEFDGDLFTDAVLPLLGVASVADGKTRFFNVENLRYKECDRITEPLMELKKIGVKCSETKSEIEIIGNPDGYDGGIEVDAHNDHRVIMMLAIIGLKCKNGLTINNAQHISKSFPNFFYTLAKLGGHFDKII